MNESVALPLPEAGERVSQESAEVAVQEVLAVTVDTTAAVSAMASAKVMDVESTLSVGAGCVTVIVRVPMRAPLTVTVAVRATVVSCVAVKVSVTAEVAAVPDVGLTVSHAALEEVLYATLLRVNEVVCVQGPACGMVAEVAARVM